MIQLIKIKTEISRVLAKGTATRAKVPDSIYVTDENNDQRNGQMDVSFFFLLLDAEKPSTTYTSLTARHTVLPAGNMTRTEEMWLSVGLTVEPQSGRPNTDH